MASITPTKQNVQPGGKAQSHTGSATNNEDRGAEGSGGQVQGRPIVVIVIGFRVNGSIKFAIYISKNRNDSKDTDNNDNGNNLNLKMGLLPNIRG